MCHVEVTVQPGCSNSCLGAGVTHTLCCTVVGESGCSLTLPDQKNNLQGGQEIAGWEGENKKASLEQVLQGLKNIKKPTLRWVWRSLTCLYSPSDAPMFISHPHFYNADPSLVDAVEGLHPSKEQHGLFLDVHPVSDTPWVLPSPQGPAQG